MYLFSFFNNQRSFIRLCKYVIVGTIFLFVAVTCFQFFQFKKESKRLVELKEDYRVYTLALKRLFDQKAKEVNQGQENGDSKKKKNRMSF